MNLVMLSRAIAQIGVLAVVLSAYGCASLGGPADIRHVCPENGGIDRKTGRAFDPESAARPSKPPIVKMIRLTDDGELVDRCEWSDVLFEVLRSPTPEHRLGFGPQKIVVLYVHGWKHDASDTDLDLRNFMDLINEITRTSSANAPNRQVIGIFVAWPGASITLPLLEQLTFWDRKRAADRVSQAGAVTKLVATIHSILTKRAREREKQKLPQDFFVAIGHSFGARILYSSVSQTLLYAVESAHPGERWGTYGDIKGPADLVVLLNPAFEASTYTALNSYRRVQEAINPQQQPVMLTVASKADLATRIAFPFGQFLDLRSAERQITTLGNYSLFFTHELRVLADGDRRSGAAKFWYDNFCMKNLCLTRTDELQPGNPFVLATTDGNVLPGHNEIWTPSFKQWLVGFITEVYERRQHQRGDRKAVVP